MSWDDSDEATWERWERARLARLQQAVERGVDRACEIIAEQREAGAREAGGGAVDGETGAAVPVRKQDRRVPRDPESLNPVYGLYDRLPHEEE